MGWTQVSQAERGVFLAVLHRMWEQALGLLHAVVESAISSRSGTCLLNLCLCFFQSSMDMSV